MSNCKVSVVIPIYKAERFLAETLDSALSQSLEDIEIIGVDDGSPDRSGEILEEYAARDKRVKPIHIANQGVGHARNVGLAAAQGDYLFHLDADDILLPDALRQLYEKCIQDELDVVFCNALVFVDDDAAMSDHYFKDFSHYQRGPYEGVMTGMEMLRQMFPDGYQVQPSLQLSRTAFLREKGIETMENVMHEDNSFFLRSIVAAQRAGFLGVNSIRYRQHSTSLMAKKPDYYNVYSLFKITQLVLDTLAGCSGPNFELLQRIATRYITNAAWIYGTLSVEEKEKRASLSQEERIAFLVLVEMHTQRQLYLQERDALWHEKEAEYRAKLQFQSERDALQAQLQESLDAQDVLRTQLQEALDVRDALWREKELEYQAKLQFQSERDALFTQRNEALAARDDALAERDAALQERDRIWQEKEEMFLIKEQLLAERDALQAEKDAASPPRKGLFRRS